MVFTDFIYRRLLEKIAAEKHEEQPARETDTQQVCSQGSDESYSEPDDDESYRPSPEEFSDPDERYKCLLENVRPLPVPLNGQVINWALLNCRSITNISINQLLHNNRLQVFILTETWLERATADQELRRDLANTYNFVQWARVNVRRGGVAIIFLNELQGTWIDLSHPTTAFEYVAAELSLGVGGPRVLVIAVYRPPLRNFDEFVNEFQDLLDIARGRYEDGNIILAGDFNVRVNTTYTKACTFLELLRRNEFVQHVPLQSTHQHGNTLDLVISSRNVRIADLKVEHNTTSDHFTVYFCPRLEDEEDE